MRATRKFGAAPSAVVMGASLSTGQQRIKLAGPVKRLKFLAAAHVVGPYEDLRHCAQAVSTLHHFGTPVWEVCHVDFNKFYPLAPKQSLRGNAIKAMRRCIDHNRWHLLTFYGGGGACPLYGDARR